MDDLWDPLDHAGLRNRIESGTLEEWKRTFPLEYGGVRMDAKNIRLEGKERFTLADQKKAWLENRELSRPLKADLLLFDKETGEQIDQRESVTLMRVPYYTDRGTFVYNGNNFTATSQSRLVPGAYSRRQNNGQLETQINVRAGTGRVFRVGLEPDTGQFRMRIGGGNFHLYSMLKGLGVTDEELEEAWGKEVVELNQTKFDKRALDRAYNKFVPEYARTAASQEEKAALVLESLEKAQIAKSVVNRTLAAYMRPSRPQKTGAAYRSILYRIMGKSAASAGFDLRASLGDKDDEGDEYQPVGVEGLLASSRKLLAINRGQDVTDERNSPAFSKIFTMDRLMRERIRLDEGKIRRNLMRMVASRRNLEPVHHRVFDPYYREIITKNPLTSPIEETNPFQLIGQQLRVTQMGPGGIGSTDAITPEMQAVQPGEFGFYSPIETPESEKAGVDVRMTWGTRVGKDGRLYHQFKNRRSGEIEWKSPADLHDKVMKIPD